MRTHDDSSAPLWAVIPAGGAGTRLWPLSRAGTPKFLLDLTGSGRTLLQQTVDRVAPLVGDRILVVTGAAHADAVRRQVVSAGVTGDQVLAEPSPRDSMAAIGLAAAVLERRDPDAVLASFAADHVIGEADAFRACVEEAAAAARAGDLVTIGIEPSHPATGFGYIELGEGLAGLASARRVTSFVEKPDAATAAAYLASGRYRWNAGMFVVRATVLLDLLAAEHPELAAGVRAIAEEPARLEEIWPGLTKIAIDHAVAEPAAAVGRVACVPGAFSWDDLGDYAALRSLAGVGDEALVVRGDDARVVAHDSTGIVVPGERLVAVLGMRDVVVVDTGDAVLVTNLEHAQQVKDVVSAVKESGRVDLV